jgi:2-phosphosulfolactate phosphatase
MAKSRYAKMLVIASFVNMSTVVDFMKAENKDFLIVCAGRLNNLGHFSLEDSVCAGLIIQKLTKIEGLELELTDAAQAALALQKAFGKSILKLLKSTEHGKLLIEIGLGDDLKVCAELDSVPVLPMLTGTVIKLRKEEPV